MLALFHRSPVESTTELAPMIIHRMPAYNPSPSGALPPAVATVVLKRQGVYIADALVQSNLDDRRVPAPACRFASVP
jgi:hypothetical protein